MTIYLKKNNVNLLVTLVYYRISSKIKHIHENYLYFNTHYTATHAETKTTASSLLARPRSSPKTTITIAQPTLLLVYSR